MRLLRAGAARDILHSITWGLLIALVLYVFRDSGPVSRIENITSDWIISLYANVVVAPTRALPLVYVDIDEKTYRSLDEPLFLPRARIAQLIKHTLEGRPRLLIVDVDFSGDGGSGDQELAEMLSQYGKKEAATQILLARTLRPALDEEDETSGLRETPVLYQRNTFLDRLTPQRPNLHWANVWLRTKPDVVVRSWPLWQTVCEIKELGGVARGRPVVLVSMPLAALALVLEGPELLLDVERQLNSPAPGDCLHPPERTSVELRLSNQSLNVGEEGRILFTLPWHLRKGEARPLVEDRRGNRAVPPRKVPLLTIISAGTLLDAKGIPGAGGALDGSIVVIGGSYFDAHDVHTTPVGQMPGALVLLNAINTVLQFPEGSLRSAPWWLEWVIDIFVIVIVALIFVLRGLPIAFGTLLSLLIGSIIVLVVACFWIESGILVGIAAPIIGIIVHRWREDLHDVWQQFWGRRHG